MGKLLKTIILITLILGVAFPLSYAYDIDPHYKFSGVKSPDSPYKNTWGAFQTDLFSGSFSYEYKIDVPPGTNGLTPKISIGYNSHSAKGKAGWVGAGWDIPQSYIQRNIQYTRKDTSDDTFELYLNGAKHDLVYVASDGKWHTKNETYLKIEKKTGGQNTLGEYWVVTDKDGTEYRFGYNLASENLVRSSDTSFTPYVWRWSLERIHDTNDNCICFNYIEDQGSVYLDNIKYNSCNNDGNMGIQFIRESKPDAYMIIDQGSEVYDAYRLSEIQISVSGTPVRKYHFSYALNESQNKSLLTTIIQYGDDGVSSLPPVKFEYKALDKGFNDGINWNTPGERRIRSVDADNDVTVETFDVNGDGLPDLVSYDTNGGSHWDIWLNTKTGFADSNLIWPVPSSPDGGWDIRDVESYPDHTPNTRSSPIDINGDGYVDFLWAYGNTTLLSDMNNNGNGFSGVSSWALPTSAWIREVRRPDNTDPNVYQEFFDMNGDGLPDLVKRENTTSWHIWINNRTGFIDYGVWQGYNPDGWLKDFKRSSEGTKVFTQVSHYDVNGDGLVDIVDAHGSSWHIYLNTGSNFIDGGLWPTTFSSDLNDVNSSGDVKRDFLDINGDGLPDIVNPVDGVQDHWEVQFNTGKGFTPRINWHMPGEVPGNGYVNNLIGSDIGRDVFDIDGDGVPDLVRHIDGVSYWRVYSNRSGQADLLSKITDTLGGTVTVNYKSSMEYPNTDPVRKLPFNYWVVASIATDNGMIGAHTVSATTGYSYANGYYDFASKEFRGFGKVIETRADGSKAIHYYYQDEVKKGKEYWAEIDDAVYNLYAGTWNNWDCQQLYPVSSTCTTTGDLSKIVYVSNLTQTDNYTYDGVIAGHKITSKLYQNYDAYGNVGLQIDIGDTDISGDEVYTYSEFWTNCASGINDRVGHTYVTAVLNGAKLREKFLTYDGVSACPTKGNLTRQENWLNTGSNPVILHEYDAYGNRTKTTDPNGHITQQIFDSMFHTFPVQIINAKNQITSRTYNVVNGQPLQETDPNGFITTYVYDTFQRKIREVKPYDTDQSPTTSIEYVLDGVPPESVIVYKKDGTPTFDTVQFVDGFGNLIKTKAEYESNMNKTVVDVFYDEMGRVKKQSNPYLTDSTLGYSLPDVNAPGTGYTYDPMGRPIQIQNPDSTQINRTFDHWNVTETDENGHAKSYAFDASQRLKQVIENNGGSSYSTYYVYSPLGELNTITDHLGNQTTIIYDSLGRKTQMIDPDMGQWLYSYDGVGNLTSQTDAKGTTTNINYDPLNRKTYIDYPNSTDIQFTYDSGTIGTLTQVADAAGTVNYQYDQRLRKVQESRTMDSNTWTTQWTYDSMDRVTTMIYPDGQTATFNYNAQGKLDNIPGIITGIDYNASGQLTQKNYANGKSTTYSYYDANQRLNKILTSGLQNFSFTYDNVGNIKSIADGVSGKTENFGYDDLDRLTGAGDGSYNLQYQYNAIGNMLSQIKDSKTTLFTYGSNAGPHAVTGVSSPLPAVGSFVINNGNVFTHTNVVTLNNISMGTPTYYMASENRNFYGASWQTYSTAPTFLFSAGFGMKTVYFKVMNADGESNVKSDTIEFRMNPADAYLDDDGDGLTNMMEFLYGTNPYKKDTDGDGKSDYTEVFGGKSSPNSPDSDKDGLDDSKDPYPSNPYHISFSENYALRHALNEGGDSRSRSAYMISDSLGNGFGKEVIPLQSHPDLSITPSPIDFKVVSVGKTRNIGLTITNSGIASLAIQSISFTGQNKNEFTKLSDTCSSQTVQPSSTCSLGIVFAPTSAGPKAADLNIQSNAPATPQKNVSLFGGCVATSTTEICDGIDNDFNPNTPDGSEEPWYGTQTTCGIGVCGNTGVLTCNNGAQVNTCTPGNPTETHEQSCSDGLDNDCDGIVDGNDSDCQTSINIHLKTGFNLISAPVDVPDAYAFLGLIDSSGTKVERIMRYDSSSGTIEEAYYGQNGSKGGDNFLMIPGEGIIIYVKEDMDIGLSQSTCPAIDLKVGMNWIGIPCQPNSATAFILLQSIGDETVVESIQRFNTVLGMFETAGYQDGMTTGINFPIHAGDGCYIYMKQGKTGFRP
jgi:YD repeat-containing protein